MSTRNGLPDGVVAVLVIEAIAVGIALASPLTPSKTGSTWSPAELVTTDPGYLEKVVASWVVVNLIVAVLGAFVWLSTWRDRPR